MFYNFATFIVRTFFKIFFRLKVYGQDNIPLTGPCIIASNHVSFFDPMAVGCTSPRELNFMARESLFKKPVLGKIITALNTFPVKRDEGDVRAFRVAIDKLLNSQAVLLFPEGTRSIDGKLQEPKLGLGFLVTKTKAMVIPCYVKGTDKAWPKSSKFPKFNSRISVYFGKPMDFTNVLEGKSQNKKESYAFISDKIMDIIKELKEYGDSLSR